MIKVKVTFVDGGVQKFKKDLNFYKSYKSLLQDGFTGKDLIHELLTDDWGPPPSAVYLDGEDEDGNKIEEMIPYV